MNQHSNSGTAAETTQKEKGEASPASKHDHQHFWLWVMCLTGVDYFSTLGYLPSIAYEATGQLAPLATVVLVFVTLFGALPVYSYVASRSPHGMGSISLLERLLHGWGGKLLVLVLLGFVVTAFIFTKTLSASDAAEHFIHNPFWNYMPSAIRDLSEETQRIVVTMVLLIVLGAMFLGGFREVIRVAVAIVGVFLTLNAVIIASGVWYLFSHPDRFQHWLSILQQPDNWGIEDVPFSGGDWGTIVLLCCWFFPKLALGLSGFETGLMVMPLIKGDPDDDPNHPKGRIRNTRKLLLTAALIMCVFLLGSSLVTTTLIPAEALAKGGRADNRALAYLAHGESPFKICPVFGDIFGSIYDLSAVVILWFAGASAMAGLLTLIPQYLPRYGMAPEWAKAIRPLIILYTCVNLLVCWIFKASVLAQSGAYATGVLVFIASGCVATLIDRWHSRKTEGTRFWSWALSLLLFGIVTIVFFYTTFAIVIERPDGIAIATIVIVTIMVSSIVSRAVRSRELRFEGFLFEDNESQFLWESLKLLEFPVLVPASSRTTRPQREGSEHSRRTPAGTGRSDRLRRGVSGRRQRLYASTCHESDPRRRTVYSSDSQMRVHRPCDRGSRVGAFERRQATGNPLRLVG
ncbi:MAG: hypothetical protein KatS3mg105_1100 [Gemmatales bacterium]|nr:MAG: hypothetical protein KatS3mg105_1100 [Gemmatales bacterium]